MSNRVFCTLIFLSVFLLQSYGQRLLEEKKESTTIYNSIYSFSKQNNVSNFVYKLIFKTPSQGKLKPVTVQHFPQKYINFEGKVIRKIIVINNGPFNISCEDSVLFSKKTLDKIGNALHVNTLPLTINNLLLFKKNDKFDSISVKESERLIRKQRYIEDSKIEGVLVKNSKDSVDVIVRVKDEFSLSPEAQFSSSKFSIGIKELNVLGLGHKVRSFYSWNTSGDINNYQYEYAIPNIKNTYINTNLLYRKNIADTTNTKYIKIERPFYSALSKWAGGISFTSEAQKYLVYIPNSSLVKLQRFEYNSQDYWGAYALKIDRGVLEKEKITNLILSARYYNIRFEKNPFPEYDPTNIYSDENLYLVGLGFSERKYFKDKYLFKYGFVEDVPIGKSYNLVGGFQEKNNTNRLYLAAKVAWGNYFKYGYLGTSIEFGSFFNGIDTEEGVFTTELNYFTPLVTFGNFKFRQFIKPQIMLGINRLNTDALSLNDYFGINGFSAERLTGTHKIVCSFQSQLYTPWNIYGFKLGPYIAYSIGALGDDENAFSKSKVYSLFGFGLLIRNDYLIFNSFQFSLSFYHYVPGNGENIFKFNSYSTGDFGFKDFEMEKPQKIRYQ